MSDESIKKLKRAKVIIDDLIEGKNPFNDSMLEDESIFNEVKMLRFLHYLSEVVDSNISNIEKPKKLGKRRFNITQEQLDRVVFPEGDIGINEFCKYVNAEIEEGMKRITGPKINNALKELEILATEIDEQGHTNTVLGPKAAEFGIHTRPMTYGNRSYNQIVYGDKGKEFLIKNLIGLVCS